MNTRLCALLWSQGNTWALALAGLGLALRVAMPAQATNGSFSKGCPHDAIGEVAPDAYRALVDAANHGTPRGYEKVPLGGSLEAG